MWPLAVLTGDRINRVFFLIRKFNAVLPGRKGVMYPKAVYCTGSCFLFFGGGGGGPPVSGNLAYCAYFILALSCRPFFCAL